MNQSALRTFYENETEREAVKEFLIECLEEVAVKRVMSRENTTSLADAKDVVEETFIKLSELFGKKPKPNVQSSR